MYDVRDDFVTMCGADRVPLRIIRQNVAEHLAVLCISVRMHELTEPFQSHLPVPIRFAIRVGYDQLADLRIPKADVDDALHGEHVAAMFCDNPECLRIDRLRRKPALREVLGAQLEDSRPVGIGCGANDYGCGHTLILS